MLSRWGRLIFVLIFSLPLFAQEKEGFPLIVPGKNGFNFYLIRDGAGQPILSTDHYPLYEGKKGDLRVTSSLQSLKEHRHLPLAPGEVEPTESEWVRNALQLKIPTATVANFLQFFQSHPEEFTQLFQGMTPTKTNLFRALLFDQELVLKSEDLKVLRRNSLKPEPAPIKIPIRVDNSQNAFAVLFRLIAEMICDIEGSEFKFKFKEKNISFDPATQVATLRLTAENAELRGPVHQIGRAVNFWQYRDALKNIPLTIEKWNIHNLGQLLYFYDKEELLLGGEVGQMILEVALKFSQSREGMWQIQLVRPLSLQLVDPDPHVKMKLRQKKNGEYVEISDNVGLNEKARVQIEDTLSDTLKQALNTYFFAEDLAFHFSLRSPSFDSQNEDNQVEMRLSKVEMLSDGIGVSLDQHLVMRKAADCIQQPEKLIRAFRASREPKSEFDLLQKTEAPATWDLVSNFPSRSGWATTTQKSQNSLISLRVPTEAIQMINLGAYASGLYCLSTRAIWPRPGYLPPVEFRPSSPPRIEISETMFRGSFEGDILTFQRNNKHIGEAFELNRRNFISFDIPASHLKEAFRLQLEKPERLQVYDYTEDGKKEFAKEESGFLIHLFDEIFVQNSANQLRFTVADIEGLFKNNIRLEKISTSKSGIDIALDPKEFVWITEHSSPEKKSAEAPLQTEFLSELPNRINDSFIRLKWHQRYSGGDAVFYSWAMKSNGVWGDWSPFESSEELLRTLPQAGKYEFQVKAMNRKFEIEKIPQSYEFYYEAQQSDLPKPVKSQAWAKPETPSSNEAEKMAEEKTASLRVAPREADKGAFGCSTLRDEEGLLQNLRILILSLVAIGWLLFARREFQRS